MCVGLIESREKSGLTRGWGIFVSEKILTLLYVDYRCMYVDLYVEYILLPFQFV